MGISLGHNQLRKKGDYKLSTYGIDSFPVSLINSELTKPYSFSVSNDSNGNKKTYYNVPDILL